MTLAPVSDVAAGSWLPSSGSDLSGCEYNLRHLYRWHGDNYARWNWNRRVRLRITPVFWLAHPQHLCRVGRYSTTYHCVQDHRRLTSLWRSER